MIRIALGFRVHTGWAAMVAVHGELPVVEVIRRQRIELLPAEAGVPRFVYHEASEMDLKHASALVKRATEAARKAAIKAVRNAVKQLRAPGCEVVAAAVPTSSARAPVDLKAILSSHSYIHSAEGELFRGALVAACEACGLRVVTPRERDVWREAAASVRFAVDDLQRHVEAMKKTIGPPWSADQKIATAAALLGLASGSDEGSKRAEARA